MTEIETSYVHNVYSRLATYASSNPCNQVWPSVKKFLEHLPPGSVLLDIGCGRAQHTAKHCLTIGIDTCPDMVTKVNKHERMEIVLANALNVPLKSDSMDGALLVSVLHHLSTLDRRRQALNEVARVLKPRAQVVIYVWAFEQPNAMFKTQDVLVPFNLHEIAKSGQLPLVKFHRESTKEERIINNSIPITIPEDTAPRWLRPLMSTRLWKMLPSRQSVPPAIPAYLSKLGNVPNYLVSGINQWSPALGRRLAGLKVEEQYATELTYKLMEESYAEVMSTLSAVSYYRYYHVFRKGELEALVDSLPEMVVVESSFDSGNWCVIAEKRGPQMTSNVQI
uniref:Methyltransf_11 domain-containing protein n=1 Tax=Panagrellus redivivus TaxID=6233 RepID=A0A7E4V3E2_PANRE